MALTRVSPALFQVSNNITSVTVGGSANTISLTFDSNGVITGASNNALSVANTLITGNIISSQIASVNGSVITANTIANSAIQTGAVENYMNAAGLGFGMRNRIINGAMPVSQYYGSTDTAVTATTQYMIDRWRSIEITDGAMSVQQSTTSTAGFNNSMKFTVTTADASLSAGQLCGFNQFIEGYNTADLGWGTANASTVTLSFWVRSSLTGTFAGAFRNSATDRTYIFNYTINSANTFEYKTITVAGDTSGTWDKTNGAGIDVIFSLGTGTTYQGTAGSWQASAAFNTSGAVSVIGTLNATFYITGVQLEKGSTATSFDYRTYTNELQLCQRYFYRVTGATGGYSTFGAGQAMSTTQGRISVHYPVTMRTTPTITYTGTVYLTDSGANGVTVTSILAQYGSESGGMLAVGVASGLTAGNATLFMTAASSGNTIQASAEL
jgi:hypothetical protein